MKRRTEPKPTRVDRELIENYIELRYRYRTLQEEIIDAFNARDWRAVGHIAHEQVKRRPLEYERF